MRFGEITTFCHGEEEVERACPEGKTEKNDTRIKEQKEYLISFKIIHEVYLHFGIF